MVMNDRENFVCAARLYSRVLNDSVWIVVGYPLNQSVEEDYPATKARLGLRPRHKAKWKIWPSPFTAPDGKNLFVFGKKDGEMRA